MAISLNGSGRSGRRSRGMPAMAEINVTPFVDVALVLLIIFMITAHVMESGIEINVPKTRTVASSTKERPVISLNKEGNVYLGKDQVNYNRLVEEVHAHYPTEDTVFVRADRETQYDPLAQVLAVLGEAKLKVSLVTQPYKSQRP